MKQTIKTQGMMQTRKRVFTIFLLGLLTAIVPLSVDMYLPSFPEIARSLNSTVTKVAFSLSSFFIGIGVGQLLYGPVMDRYGKKRPLIIGLCIYIAASICCFFSTSIEMLVIFRFIQAIGACSGTIAATALVRDLFPPEENARIFSFLILILSVSPLLAPTLGGYIGAIWGWTSIFALLTILIGLLLAGVWLYLPPGRKGEKHYSLKPAAIGKNYAAILKVTQFTGYALIGTVAFSALFTYIAGSPGIFINDFQLTTKQFGLLFALLASGLTIASQLNNFLLKHFQSQQIIQSALLLQFCFGILLFVSPFLVISSFWIIVIILFFYLASLGLIIPNATALAMEPFTANAGSASALLGFFQMGVGSLATLLVGTLHIEKVPPLAFLLIIISLIGLGLAAWTKRVNRDRSKQKSNIADSMPESTICSHL